MLIDQYEYFFLDVGNILFHDMAVEMVFDYFVYCKLENKAQKDFFRVREQELECGNLRWLYEYCSKCDNENAQEILRSAWEDYVIPNWLDINVPIKDAIEAAYQISKHTPIAIAANQPIETIDLLNKYGVTDFVDQVFLDADIGVSKPEKKFFDIILERTSQKKEKVLFVGDRIDNDIKPACQYGISPIWIQYHTDDISVKFVPEWWQKQFYDSYTRIAVYNLWKYDASFDKKTVPYTFNNLHDFSKAYRSKKI